MLLFRLVLMMMCILDVNDDVVVVDVICIGCDVVVIWVVIAVVVVFVVVRVVAVYHEYVVLLSTMRRHIDNILMLSEMAMLLLVLLHCVV